MVRYPSPDIKYVSRFDQFLRQALSDITGEEILINSVSGNKDLIPCLCHKIAKDTGLDSCDIAAWISSSLKQYWAETDQAGSNCLLVKFYCSIASFLLILYNGTNLSDCGLNNLY